MILQITTFTRNIFKRSWVAALGAAVVLVMVAANAHASGTSTLSLVSSQSSYANGDTFTVTVHVNNNKTCPDASLANQNDNCLSAVGGYVDFDSTKLQYVTLTQAYLPTFDLPGTPTENPLKDASGNPTSTHEVRLAVGASVPVTGDQVIGTITFKVIEDAGASTNLVFNTDSSQGSFVATTGNASANDWNGNATGLTVAVPKATTSGGTTGSTTTKKAGSTGASTTPTSSPTPSPTPNAAPTASAAATGYLVAIKVTDASGKIVSGAKVTLDGTTTESTLTNGIASFTGVKSGAHTVTTAFGTTKVTQTITVNDSGANLQIQQFGVKVAGSKQQNYFWIIAMILALVVISGGGLTLGQALTQHHRAGVTQVHGTATTMVPSVQETPDTSSPIKQVFYPQPSEPATDANDNNQDGSTNA